MFSLTIPVRWRTLSSRTDSVWILYKDLNDEIVILDVFGSEAAAKAEHDRLAPCYRGTGIFLGYDEYQVNL